MPHVPFVASLTFKQMISLQINWGATNAGSWEQLSNWRVESQFDCQCKFSVGYEPSGKSSWDKSSLILFLGVNNVMKLRNQLRMTCVAGFAEYVAAVVLRRPGGTILCAGSD